jgi:MerR family transcriptional regulator, copper efflux regulator
VSQYRISQLAETVGVPATTLRYYETRGLLPAQRNVNGYRTYDERDVERIRFIATGKALGLSLTQIRDLVTVWQDGMCRDVRDRLLPLVADQLDDLDSRVQDLRHVRAQLVAARDKLKALSSRDNPCDPACTVLADREPTPQLSCNGEPMAIACSLSAGDYTDRVQRWHDVLADTTPERTADGAVRVLLDADRLLDLVALIVEETRCCPFFTFTVTVTHAGVQLEASASDDAQPLLDELFLGTPTGSCAC